MPLYYFDLINGTGLIRDEEGAALPDDDAARARAIEQLRPIIAHGVLAGQLETGTRVVVRREDGEQLLEIGFDEAVRPESEDEP